MRGGSVGKCCIHCKSCFRGSANFAGNTKVPANSVFTARQRMRWTVVVVVEVVGATSGAVQTLHLQRMLDSPHPVYPPQWLPPL